MSESSPTTSPSPVRRYRQIQRPVHTMHRELAALLTEEPGFAQLVPGGIHTQAIDLDRPDAYPEMFARQAEDAPADDFRTNLAVLALQRVETPGGESQNGITLYTRLEVRGPRGNDGYDQVIAVWQAIDRALHRRRIRVGTYVPTVEVLGDFRPPVDDPGNDLGLFSWSDVRARLALS